MRALMVFRVTDQKKRWLIVISLVGAAMLYRAFFAEFFSEKTLVALVVTLPFTYWFVAPVIARQKMEMPSWGFALEPGKNLPARALLFTLGLLILVAGALG